MTSPTTTHHATLERWADAQGLVLKDLPDRLVAQADETGDTRPLDAWLETHEPLTLGMWDD